MSKICDLHVRNNLKIIITSKHKKLSKNQIVYTNAMDNWINKYVFILFYFNKATLTLTYICQSVMIKMEIIYLKSFLKEMVVYYFSILLAD